MIKDDDEVKGKIFVLLSACYALYEAFKLTCTMARGKEAERVKRTARTSTRLDQMA